MNTIRTIKLYEFVRALDTPHLPPLQRRVYGVIASGRGMVMSPNTIINAVWGNRWRDGATWELAKFDAKVPANPSVALRVMVHRLRARGYGITHHAYDRGYSLTLASRDTVEPGEGI